MQAKEIKEDGEDILCSPVSRESSGLFHPPYNLPICKNQRILLPKNYGIEESEYKKIL